MCVCVCVCVCVAPIQTFTYFHLTPFLSHQSAKACTVKLNYILFRHLLPCYSFIHSFIYFTISSKISKTIHYFSTTIICCFNPILHNATLPLIQMTKLNEWKPGPVSQHMAKTLKVYLWDDITTEQRPSNYELTRCIKFHSTEYRTH